MGYKKGDRGIKCKTCSNIELVPTRNRCKPCYTAQRLPYRFAESLKSRYGITVEFYYDLLKKQNDVCAICIQPETSKHQNGQVKRLAVDHCHSTGKVRGLLCKACNQSLGLIKENFIAATKLAFYIAEHKGI